MSTTTMISNYEPTVPTDRTAQPDQAKSSTRQDWYRRDDGPKRGARSVGPAVGRNHRKAKAVLFSSCLTGCDGESLLSLLCTRHTSPSKDKQQLLVGGRSNQLLVDW
jgi:hypothetical protein